MSCCLSVLYYMLLSAHSVVANSLNLIFSEKALLLLLSVLGTQMAKVKGWGKLKWIFQIVFGTYYICTTEFNLLYFNLVFIVSQVFHSFVVLWLMMKQVFSHVDIILLLKVWYIIKLLYSLGFFTNAKQQQQNIA